ncbi:ABC transporter permease, partial [Salipiger sp. HF18]|nr:ABC transporter permease [Salipiger sp. HF18]
MWKRFRSNIGAVIGVVLLVLVIAIAIFAPLIFANSPWQMVQRPFLAPFAMDGLPLGTDTLGRDVAAQLAYGARVSLLVGLVSTLVALLIGVPLGALAGFYGGYVDEGAMRFTEF